MNKSKGKYSQYEVRLTAVETQVTTWVITAQSEAEAENKMRTMNVARLHDSEVSCESHGDEYVMVRPATSSVEVTHG